MIPTIGCTVRLALVMLVIVDTVAIAILVGVAVMVVHAVVKMVIAHGFLRIQGGPLTLWRSAVLSHLVDKKDFGHVVDDEHFGPVRDWLGLGTTEMNVHDEDGERGGRCDHSHGGNVVFPL